MFCRVRASVRATGTPKPKPAWRRTVSQKSLHPFRLQRRSVMFDKISKAAERVATNVSRRIFLGRLGQGALAAAGVVAGMVAFGAEARAAPGLCPRKHTF